MEMQVHLWDQSRKCVESVVIYVDLFFVLTHCIIYNGGTLQKNIGKYPHSCQVDGAMHSLQYCNAVNHSFIRPPSDDNHAPNPDESVISIDGLAPVMCAEVA